MLMRCIQLTALVMVLIAIPAFPTTLPQSMSPTRSITYKVSAMGTSIGDVVSEQRIFNETERYRIYFKTKTNIKASFLWFSHSQHTVETGELSNGNLVKYSFNGEENGVRKSLEGHLETDGFRFSIEEDGVKRSFVIPRGSYDHTTMECPESRIDFADGREKYLRVLDVENAVVVKRQYQLVREELYSLDNREHPCRVVDMIDQRKKMRRWIAWDGGTVVLYRQDGRGGKGSYSVKAVSLKHTP